MQSRPPSQAGSTPWRASLHVTGDAMKVFLVLEQKPGGPETPGAGGNPPAAAAGPAAAPPPLTMDLVRSLLEERGVAVPIDEQAVQRLLDDPVAVCALIAEGTPPRPGREARMDVLVGQQGPGGPMEREDGRIDWRERGAWVHVEPGTPLALLRPPVPGCDGRDVFGRVVPAPKAQRLRVRIGRGVTVIGPHTNREAADPQALEAAARVLEEHGLDPAAGDAEVFVAVQAGRPVVSRDPRGIVRVEVRPVLEVPGDVDLSTGHIRFQGDVTIRGSVADDMIVEAGGDVVIRGNVDRAFIKAGKNVEIRGGTAQSRIEAGEMARLAFINQSQVTAGRLVEVGSRGAYLSTIRAPIVVARGPLIGGSVEVVKRLEAAEAGSVMGARTTLVAGPEGELRVRTAHPQVLLQVGWRKLLLTRVEYGLRCRLVAGELELR